MIPGNAPPLEDILWAQVAYVALGAAYNLVRGLWHISFP
jgi:hypothetical protein